MNSVNLIIDLPCAVDRVKCFLNVKKYSDIVIFFSGKKIKLYGG